MTEKPKLNPWLKLALDIGPLLLFVTVLVRFDIYAATATFMVRAAFAAGVRSSAAPISSTNIISAASIAFATRSVTLFAAGPWSIGDVVHMMVRARL